MDLATHAWCVSQPLPDSRNATANRRNRLAVGTVSGMLQIYDMNTASLEQQHFVNSGSGVKGLDWSGMDQILCFGSDDAGSANAVRTPFTRGITTFITTFSLLKGITYRHACSFITKNRLNVAIMLTPCSFQWCAGV